MEQVDSEILRNCTMAELSLEDPAFVTQTMQFTESMLKLVRDFHETMRRRYGETAAKIIVASALIMHFNPTSKLDLKVNLPYEGLGELMVWLRDNPRVRAELGSQYRTETAQLVRDMLKNA